MGLHEWFVLNQHCWNWDFQFPVCFALGLHNESKCRNSVILCILIKLRKGGDILMFSILFCFGVFKRLQLCWRVEHLLRPRTVSLNTSLIREHYVGNASTVISCFYLMTLSTLWKTNLIKFSGTNIRKCSLTNIIKL